MGNVIGNAIGSFFSGFGQVIAKIFGSELDFLSGKSCNSMCGPTWDLTCYIENFCIAHLLKLAAVSFLLYVVMLFFYSFYKLGICQCLCRSLCKLVWACLVTYFSAWWHCFYFMCQRICMVKRRHKRLRRDIEMLEMSCASDDTDEESGFPYLEEPYRNIQRKRRLQSWPSREYKGDRLRRSLRPRSHRIRVAARYGHPGSSLHNIRVIQTSKFAKKGTKHKRSKHRRYRR